VTMAAWMAVQMADKTVAWKAESMADMMAAPMAV
jgi:hypothetical protein